MLAEALVDSIAALLRQLDAAGITVGGPLAALWPPIQQQMVETGLISRGPRVT
jgi:hypothetical protein